MSSGGGQGFLRRTRQREKSEGCEGKKMGEKPENFQKKLTKKRPNGVGANGGGGGKGVKINPCAAANIRRRGTHLGVEGGAKKGTIIFRKMEGPRGGPVLS